MLPIYFPIFVAVACWFLGGFVIWKQPQKRLNQYFCFLLVIGGTWALSETFRTLAGRTGNPSFFPARFDIITTILTGYSLVLFSWYFPYPNENLAGKKFWFLGGMNFILLILGLTPLYIDKVQIINGAYVVQRRIYFYFFFLIPFISQVIYSIFNIWRKGRRAKNELERKRVKYLYLGFALGFLVGITGTQILPAVFKINEFTALAVSGPFIGNLPVAFAIVRYRLMEIDTVIHRTFVWLLTSVSVFIPALIVFYLLFPFFGHLNWIQSSFIFILLYFILSLLQKYLQPRINILFRRRRYDYFQVLAEVVGKIGSILDLNGIIERLMSELMTILSPRAIIVLIWNEKMQQYIEHSRKISKSKIIDIAEKMNIQHNSDVEQWFVKQKVVMEQEQLEANPDYEEIRTAGTQLMNAYHLELLIPVFFQEELRALIGLGKRETLQAYTLKDVELLGKIGCQIGIVIDNALHHEEILEKQQLANEMRLGRKIQVGLLPEKTPQIKGLQLAYLNEPAITIAGDYFDFIPFGNGKGDTTEIKRLGIVIGDVSGKGVSAGLLMAVAKASIWSIAQVETDPRSILVKTNATLYQYMKAHNFMSMVYLDWDAQLHQLRYCGAGHEKIILYSSGENTCKVIPVGGIVLGVMPNVANILTEQIVSVQKGDKIVLYTDGVTDAKNNNNESFTFEKLEQIVKTNGKLTIQELIDTIKQELFSFIKNTPQYDDITLVGLEINE